MKKTVALLLALMMMLLSCSALADTMDLVPGGGSSCPIGDFQTLFDLFTGSSGYVFTLNGTTTENGYDVYQYVSSDGILKLNVYAKGGLVSHALGEAEATVTATNTDQATKMGEWFGASLTAVVLALYYQQTGSLDEAAVTEFQNALTPLASAISALDDAKLLEGVVVTADTLGYHCGIELSGTENILTGTMRLKMGIACPDGEIRINQ